MSCYLRAILDVAACFRIDLARLADFGNVGSGARTVGLGGSRDECTNAALAVGRPGLRRSRAPRNESAYAVPGVPPHGLSESTCRSRCAHLRTTFEVGPLGNITGNATP